MKKHFNDLTQLERAKALEEIARMYRFGSACIDASAKNAGENRTGWPSIEVISEGNVAHVALCDILDVLTETIKSGMFKKLGLGIMFTPPEEVVEAITHQAMHDAFCMGIAMSSLLELDFTGVEDFMDQSGGWHND